MADTSGKARNRIAAALLGVAALAVTSACSTVDTTATTAAPGSGSGSGPAGGGAAVVVDAPATTSSSAVYLGARNGAFAQAGVAVQAHNHTSSDSPLVGLLGNAYPIVWDNAADYLLAVQKKLPVTVVGLSDLGRPGQLDVLAQADSPIHSVRDLVGHSVAIPGTTSSCALTIPAQLRAAGVDPKSVKLVPVALTDEGSALQRGIVDAACAPEPFLSTIRKTVRTRSVADQFTGPLTDTLVGVYVTTADYARQHPDVIAAFRKALAAENTALNADPDALRKAVPTFTKVDASLAAGMKLPGFATNVIDTAPLQKLAELMRQAGMLTSATLPADVMAADR
ncbi:ABC transporter substrate-binding protein [Amycolatopsis rhabdoformis]|uniref:ABC transporter substrate-binding protein n=1 Tax=Amycolatopsis rhabdoformis TaxID=1448059 RepID=A0ABZ1IDK2_9PSEU|nr:ABC transporter substrate-binding protein [Amycolatopsis rhabdoformis]WSE31997.1 ABC transporter substrate-binding protein [Amycolatopsis rhabdoformis]